jgi:hypothetical protein
MYACEAAAPCCFFWPYLGLFWSYMHLVTVGTSNPKRHATQGHATMSYETTHLQSIVLSVYISAYFQAVVVARL